MNIGGIYAGEKGLLIKGGDLVNLEKNEIFSFSSCWNVLRHTSGREMVAEILELGFRKIELNYRVTEEMASEILPLVEAGIVDVSSIHNVFPRNDNPDFSPDSIFLAQPDISKRKEAIDITKQTIDRAVEFGAAAVVLHTSEIPMPRQYDSILKSLYMEGKRNTDEYNNIKDEFINFRKSLSNKYVELTYISLVELCNYIEQKVYDVVLGIENRSQCQQIPDFDEAEYLLEKLKDLPVYFWYDIGHAIIQDNLGVLNHHEGLQKVRHKIYGVHIHDTVGLYDHCCPYTNDDFYKYIDIIREAPLKVLEISRRESRENIIKSTDKLYRELIGEGR